MTYYRYLFCICALLISCTAQRKHSRRQSQESIKQEDIRLALFPEHKHVKNKTGVYTLEGGGQSLIARLWLIDHAQKSIDLQYFSFAKDITGLIVCDHLIRAADRGVKVRIIIDDAASKMYSYEVKLLESHENIEIRVYNAGLMLGRPDKRLGRFARNINRLLRRMHNKTFTVDEEVAIIGGRNLADEYFDFSRKYNFRDRDVLLAGPVVTQLKNAFEAYWTDQLTVPYYELSKKIKKKRFQDSLRFEHIHRKAESTKKFPKQTRERIGQFANDMHVASQSGLVTWVNHVNFVSDKPGKNSDKQNRRGGIATDTIAALIKSAKKNIIINTPYFIPTDELTQLLKASVERGVKIRLMTNSLASTDQPAAFSAYKKIRNEFLRAGLQIYEFKPRSAERYTLMLPDVQKKKKYKSVFGFHSKSLIIDESTVVIGSYNLDPRSADYNTECVAVVRSEGTAKNLSMQMEQEFLPENSWEITESRNSDSKAPLAKRIKAFFLRIVPAKVL